MDIISYCQQQFSFDLPSVLWAKRVSRFNQNFDNALVLWVVFTFVTRCSQIVIFVNILNNSKHSVILHWKSIVKFS